MQSKLTDGKMLATGYDAVRGVWTFTLPGVPVIELARDSLSAQVLERALVEGMSDRIIDTGAIDQKAPDGHIRTFSEKVALKAEAVRAIVAHFASGTDQWSRKAGPGAGDGGLVIEAIMAVNSETRAQALERVEKWMKSLSKSRAVVLESFAANPRVAKAMQELREVRVKAAGVDSNAMLDEMPSA